MQSALSVGSVFAQSGVICLIRWPVSLSAIVTNEPAREGCHFTIFRLRSPCNQSAASLTHSYDLLWLLLTISLTCAMPSRLLLSHYRFGGRHLHSQFSSLRPCPIILSLFLQSLIIVAVSLLCAMLTCLSLSAIVTNGPAREGGTYFLISRALGPRIGGAVGFMYYLGVSLLAVLEVKTKEK
jgi:hypothetical protein